MQDAEITLRPLYIKDIDAAMALSIDTGWNQTEQDWKFMLADPQHICVAAIHNEKVIGTTVALNYSDQLAWIGMVLVDKNHRGKGLSRLLLEYVFEKCKTAIKLDATALGEPVYQKFGFLPEYTIARMVNTNLDAIHTCSNHLLQQAQPVHIPHITALDKKIFGANRNKLITYYLQHYPQKAWILEENSSIKGFVLGREGYRFHHVGPVIAETAELAAVLIMHALAKLAGEPVVVDVLCSKSDLIQLLAKYGFIEQRRFVRMYKEHNPFAGDIQKLFAIAGPEFG